MISPDNALIVAAKQGNLVKIQERFQLLDEEEQKASINYAIIYSAENGHLDILKFLCEQPIKEIDLEFKDNYAISYAAAEGHLDVVKFLCEQTNRSVNLAARDNHPVRYAAYYGKLDVVKYLCQLNGRGVDPAACNNFAVRFAAAKGHIEVLQYLCTLADRGIDLTMKNYVPFRDAVFNGRYNIAKYLNEFLLAKGDYSITLSYNSAFQSASAFRNICQKHNKYPLLYQYMFDVVAKHIAKQADCLKKTRSGYFPSGFPKELTQQIIDWQYNDDDINTSQIVNSVYSNSSRIAR